VQILIKNDADSNILAPGLYTDRTGRLTQYIVAGLNGSYFATGRGNARKGESEGWQGTMRRY